MRSRLILRDGRACIDNSAAELAIRPIGRKTRLDLARSDAGGDRAAAIYGLIETAKLHGLDQRPTCVMCSSASPIIVNRVTDLLPWNTTRMHRRLDQRIAA